ncbi:MAG: hypothetical protein NC417_11330 [Candidatus Gastranaerophilales bacterium]|nr:hypothetical protein [Candidatus Gastranaerophilales bacterium]
MSFWRKLFRKRRKPDESISEDWNRIVYARESVDFASEEQRSRYVTNCLEQMAEASREIDLLTGEYNLVTAYLTDVDEIEALPEEERQDVDLLARQLTTLDQEIQRYRGKANRMSDDRYYQMRKLEDDVTEGIAKLKEAESYADLVKRDLRRLDGERHAYEFRRAELYNMMNNLRGMAIIFLTALSFCVLLLLVLQFGFEMDAHVGYILAIGTAAISLTVLSVKFTDTDRERERVERALNKIIQLQNKVKIRYVNNTQLLDYLYMKYDTDSSKKLEGIWNEYLQEREERKQYAEAEAKSEYYQKQLVSRLSHYRVSDPHRWLHQVQAFLDRREMVEIRHELIQRRQSLRKQMDYNTDVAQTARKEIMDVVGQYPTYAREILEMVERYESAGLT